MTGRLLALAAILAVSAWPVAGQATVLTLGFEGSGMNGFLSITYEANANTGILPQTAPNPVDPIGSYVITNVAGSFTDTNIGINHASITGIAKLNRVDPEPTNLLAPNSFSLLPIANGVDEGNGIFSPGFHYDNLLYPDGSPQTASDYPFSGGLFDIYGLVFTLTDGKSVNIWSNGVQPPPAGLNYGVAVTDGTDALDYVSGLSVSAVPEASTWAMMITGFGLVGLAMRRPRRIRATVRFA